MNPLMENLLQTVIVANVISIIAIAILVLLNKEDSNPENDGSFGDYVKMYIVFTGAQIVGLLLKDSLMGSSNYDNSPIEIDLI